MACIRRRLHVGAGEVEEHRRGVIGRPDVQCLPIDGNPPAADAEKAAEIDHRRARPRLGIEQHIHHQPHVLAPGP
ncbi:MAG: hypothetical protein U1E43_05325 [Rhodospirillales bacterium]